MKMILAMAAVVAALGAAACSTTNYYGAPSGGARVDAGDSGGRRTGTFTRLKSNTTGKEFCMDDRTREIFDCPKLPPIGW